MHWPCIGISTGRTLRVGLVGGPFGNLGLLWLLWVLLKDSVQAHLQWCCGILRGIEKLWKFAFRRYSQPLSIQAQDPAKTWVKTCVENKAAWQGAQSQIMHIFVIKTWSLYLLLSLRTKFGSGPHGQVRNVFPQYYGNWPPIFDNFLHLDMQWPELPPQCPIHLPFVHLIQQPKESNDALRYALAVLANMHGLSCARHSSGALRRTVSCFHYWL